ncbi:hypothetical protein [Dysgonomonas sp. GY617]|uniref:hypothetical protein n=1 Tax=Dysgonomonas sp. GY617 TaxID=2780420 RepID=UPI0018831CB5|nr:hypothetical protein [Dysgonomonas sp. GY617]MBF0577599.1 hypothetical protein [Dysgonomonas sp. GY617]
MWIKEPPKTIDETLYTGIGKSNYDLNFLYHQDKIYVMDNHLAAAYSWLNGLSPNESHNFIHIDRHSDLLGAGDRAMDELRTNPKMDLSRFLSLKNPYILNSQLFTWDNYINNIRSIYPNWFTYNSFACHEFIEDDRPIPDPFTVNENIPFKTDNIFDGLRNSKEQWIVNLDIDYFFDDVYSILFTDEEITMFCDNLLAVWDSVSILTIALSPSCCGGWVNAYRVAKIITDKLGIDFELNNIS